MSDPVPAIAEASAAGVIAELFADIRRVLGVEVVNLIWRHLATIPDALPWAWGMLRPLYADGTIAAEAQALHGRLALPRLPPLPADLLAAIGLGSDEIASIRNILAAYDRTNAMALVALSALLCRLEGQPATSEPIVKLDLEPSPRPPARIRGHRNCAQLPDDDAITVKRTVSSGAWPTGFRTFWPGVTADLRICPVPRESRAC